MNEGIYGEDVRRNFIIVMVLFMCNSNRKCTYMYTTL